MKGTTVFSRIELRSKYRQVCIKEEDIHKTAFWTRYGHYEFMVVLFKLTNTPSTFMCLINNTFIKYLDKFLLVFLYDILVYSHNEVDHEDNLRLVL